VNRETTLRGQQTKTSDRALARLFLALTILVSTIVGAHLGRKQLSNPFLHYDIAFTEAARRADRVEFPDHGSLSGARYGRGRQLWMIAVGGLLGLESQIPLQFMPIGSVLLSMAYFAMFKRLLGSNVMAGAMTVHQMINPSQLLGLYSTFAYGLGMTLYLGVLLLLVRTFDKKHRVEVVLLFFIGAAINFVHYAFTVWVILTVLVLSLWIWLGRRCLQRPVICGKAQHLVPFALFMLVVFLTCNEAFYDSYLAHVMDAKTLGGGWAAFFNRLPWVRTAVGEAAYEFTYRRIELISALSSLHLLLIVTPVIIGVSIWVIACAQRRAVRCRTVAGLVLWALIPVGVIDTAIYALRGNIGVKYFVLVYPMATVWFVKHLGGRRRAFMGIILLLGLSAMRLGVELREGQLALEPLSYSETKMPTEWYHQHALVPDGAVLSDLNLYGKLLVEGAAYDHRPGLLVITPGVYDWLLGRHATDVEEVARSDYIILDVGSEAPLMTPFWRSLEPLRSHRASIAHSNATVKLYDDGAVWILRP